MKIGDMVTHTTNPAWSRGKVYAIIPGEKTRIAVLWGNGDLEHCYPEELELLGWNLHERGHKN